MIREELKNRVFMIAVVLSLVIFTLYGFNAAEDYRNQIQNDAENTKETVLDWKTLEEHRIQEILEKKNVLKTEKDRIELDNGIAVAKYRIEKNLEPKADFNSVKGFMEYVYSGKGEQGSEMLYIVTVIIMLAAITINFDRTTFYYVGAVGYKKLFFSKVVAELIFAVIMWIINFIVIYAVGVLKFGPFNGEAINFIDGVIVTASWKANMMKALLLSMTYPIFSAALGLTVSAVVRNKIAAVVTAILLYTLIQPLRTGIYSTAAAKYSFIGNMYLLKPINGVPDIYLNSIQLSAAVDIVSLAVLLGSGFLAYRRFIKKNYREQRA